MSRPSLTISQLARQAGIGVETVRYYERMGLISQPVKPEQGYRIYPEQTLLRLMFISRAKQLGFSLNEIKELLSLEEAACRQTREIANDKLTEVQQKIRDLQALAYRLESLMDACETNTQGHTCPIIDVLASEPPT